MTTKKPKMTVEKLASVLELGLSALNKLAKQVTELEVHVSSFNDRIMRIEATDKENADSPPTWNELSNPTILFNNLLARVNKLESRGEDVDLFDKRLTELAQRIGGVIEDNAAYRRLTQNTLNRISERIGGNYADLDKRIATLGGKINAMEEVENAETRALKAFDRRIYDNTTRLQALITDINELKAKVELRSSRLDTRLRDMDMTMANLGLNLSGLKANVETTATITPDPTIVGYVVETPNFMRYYRRYKGDAEQLAGKLNEDRKHIGGTAKCVLYPIHEYKG